MIQTTNGLIDLDLERRTCVHWVSTCCVLSQELRVQCSYCAWKRIDYDVFVHIFVWNYYCQQLRLVPFPGHLHVHSATKVGNFLF